jgi:hypothetical protein
MNDAFLLDDDLASASDETVTIRLGAPSDTRAIERLAELDEGDAGIGPHLVADEDGEIVATLSLADGTVRGNPFRRTAEVVALLRLRAEQLHAKGRERRSMLRALGRLATSMLAAAALTAVLATSAFAAQAAPKPGFMPGTWKVVGTIAGSSVDGPMTTVFTGKVGFTLTVAKSLKVGGDGTWAMTMTGTGPVASTMNGTAAVKLSGTSVDVRFAGQQSVTGTVGDGVRSTPIRMNRPLNGKLVITRAGKCRVTGTSPMGGGAKLTWTALLAGSGTCRA